MILKTTDKIISIVGCGSVSPLGSTPDIVWQHYLEGKSKISSHSIGSVLGWAASLHMEAEQERIDLLKHQPQYTWLDRSVQLAIMAARKAITKADWVSNNNLGVNIGSSRGATALFEENFKSFLEKGTTPSASSPSTTLGNISSSVAQDLGVKGPVFSHSITCSTAIHALLNGIAWLRAGMAQHFIVGGTEASLTPFTLAQMRALRLYSMEKDSEFPCRSFDLEKKQNTMVLGEGGAVLAIQVGPTDKALAVIEGIGYGMERIAHAASVSDNGEGLFRSMQMALGDLAPEMVDVVVMHAPGTIKGDQAEWLAIKRLFTEKLPGLTTNKWMMGHTLGASGALSIEMALLMLQHQQFIPIPFANYGEVPKTIKYVMVNAIGFGGNAASILMRRA